MVGKEEIARYEQFLVFPQCFKSCLLLMRQNEYLWSKGLQFIEQSVTNPRKKPLKNIGKENRS